MSPIASQSESRTEDPPFVSVVIPTHMRAASTELVVRSVLHCDYPEDRFEIIVVDGRSSDGTAEVVQGLGEEHPGRVKCLVKEPRGPSASRNLGASQAKGSILAFIDSDCEADVLWLRRGVEPFRNKPKLGIVQGRTLPPERSELALRARYVRVERLDGVFHACNIFYRKDAFDSVGGFSSRYFYDPRPEEHGWSYRFFPWLESFMYILKYTGEDTDLGWRVKNQGWDVEFSPDAVVYHEVRVLSPFRWLIDEACYSYAAPRMARIHHGLRSYLYAGLFVNRNHAWFTLFIASLILGAVWHWGWLALTLPYMVGRASEPSRFWRGPVRLLRFLVHLPRDAISLGLLTVSSIQNRSLVL